MWPFVLLAEVPDRKEQVWKKPIVVSHSTCQERRGRNVRLTLQDGASETVMY